MSMMNVTTPIPAVEHVCDKIVLSATNYIYVIASVIYALPTFTLYSLIINMIYKKSNCATFNSPFYHLFAFNSVMCMGAFLVDFFVNRFWPMGLLCTFFDPILRYHLEDTVVTKENASLITAQFHFFSYFFLFSVLISATFISLNRLTAVMFPMENKRIWSILLPLSIACSLVVPLVGLWHLLISPAYLALMTDVDDGSATLALNYIKTVKWIKNSQLGALVATVTGGCKLLFTIMTFFAMRRHTDNLGLKTKTERDLFFVGLWMAVAAMTWSATQTTLYHTLYVEYNDPVFNLMFRIRPYVTDLVVISPPWLLLCIGSTVRENILTTVGSWFGRDKRREDRMFTITTHRSTVMVA